MEWAEEHNKKDVSGLNSKLAPQLPLRLSLVRLNPRRKLRSTEFVSYRHRVNDCQFVTESCRYQDNDAIFKP